MTRGTGILSVDNDATETGYKLTVRFLHAATARRFKVPLARVAEAFRVAGIPATAGQLRSLLTEEAGRHELRSFRKSELFSKDSVRVQVEFDPLTVLSDREAASTPGRDVNYRMEDGCLTGPARKLDKEFRAPVLVVHIDTCNFLNLSDTIVMGEGLKKALENKSAFRAVDSTPARAAATSPA